jgi:3-oxoacyl-[acyl-carrier-protein] synthase-3
MHDDKRRFSHPFLACVVQKEIGAGCPAFDLNAACSGFVYALDVAEGYFKCKPGEAYSDRGLRGHVQNGRRNDRSTCVLFGDGAAAAVLGEGSDFFQ